MKGHIDKLTKNIEFEIDNKPIGAVQWDFICSIPEATQSMINNYEKGPESAFVYLTSKCKMNCDNCTQKQGYELNVEDIEYLINNQIDKRLNYIILDGDPFQYPNIKEVIDVIKQNNITYSINSFTEPTEEMLDYIKGSVAKIQFKMNNIDCENEYTKEVIRSLKKCKEKNIYTAIIFSIDGENYNQIKDMIEFCKEYNVKQFSFSRLELCYKKNKYNYITKNNYLKLSKELQRIRANEDKIHITSNDAIWKGCGACSTTLTIMPNGDIVPCAYINVVCGNIKDREIDKAWKSKTFKDIRESNLEGKCGKCKYSFLCKGCRAIPFIEEKNYLGEDKGCWI